jgi:hypothetical protein
MLAGHRMLHSCCRRDLRLLLSSSYPAFPLRSKSSHRLAKWRKRVPKEAPGTSFESLQAATCTALARPSWLRDGFRHYVLTDCSLTGCCLSTPGPNHVPQADCCTEGQFRSSCSLSRIACRHVTLSTTLPTALESQLDCPRTHTAEAFP